MQEYLAELSGTLARKQQRKNTVLSHINKEAQLQKKADLYGFATRPHNPAEVKDAKAARHFLNEVRGEIGHKIARINNPLLVSMERDGEIAVRQLNDDIHRLLIARNRWITRNAELNVELSAEEEAIAKSEREGVRQRRRYFGCSSELPEALKQKEADATHRQRAVSGDKRPRQDDAVVDSEERIDDANDDVQEENIPDESSAPDEILVANENDDVRRYLRSVEDQHNAMHDGADAALRKEEAIKEEAWRRDHAHCQATSHHSTTYVYDFCANGDHPEIPSDEEVKKALFERKKAAMKLQLAALAHR